jgi:hypothetical protein
VVEFLLCGFHESLDKDTAHLREESRRGSWKKSIQAVKERR